jgi:tungstate transport system substrate-binding protein
MNGVTDRTLNHWLRKWFCLLAVTLCLSACNDPTPPVSEQILRLAVVNTPEDSGLLAYLLADFEASTGLQVDIHSSDDPFARARTGHADLLISHYGKAGLEDFVSEGYGSWPKMVFSNQAVLIGPKADPAQVSRTSTLAEALRAIATGGYTLIANNIDGITELTALAAKVAGLDTESAWYQDNGVSKGKAVKAAQQQGAYVIWGAIPFLKFQARHDTNQAILFSEDPLLHRVMVISRVKHDLFPDINHAAAKKLENYLLSTETQAKVMAFRSPGSVRQLWWPAARHN